MKVLKEKEIRDNIRYQLKEMVNKASKVIREGDKDGIPDSVNFDAEGIPGVPKKIEKLFDPDTSPQQFMKFNALADASTNPSHQALAILGFAMDYSDNDIDNAVKMLVRAKSLAPKIKAAIEKKKKSKEGQAPEEGADKEKKTDFKWND